MQTNSQSRAASPGVWRWVLLITSLAAAYGASFAPWIYRPPAALILTAPDLAEFVKFLPEVRSGSLSVHRLAFLAPLFTITLSLPIVVSSRWAYYPKIIRVGILAAVVPLALTLLPPVWSPPVLTSTEFRAQTVACLVALALTAASIWVHKLPGAALSFLPILWLTGTALATWQFSLILPSIATAYASPVTPGWGLWLIIASSIGTLAAWYMGQRCRRLADV
jgi:hypothetical protein